MSKDASAEQYQNNKYYKKSLLKNISLSKEQKEKMQ